MHGVGVTPARGQPPSRGRVCVCVRPGGDFPGSPAPRGSGPGVLESFRAGARTRAGSPSSPRESALEWSRLHSGRWGERGSPGPKDPGLARRWPLPGARREGSGVAVRAPRPARTYQMKSVQWLQKVGCLKKRAVNLWLLTSWTTFCLRAPFLQNRGRGPPSESPPPGPRPAMAPETSQGPGSCLSGETGGKARSWRVGEQRNHWEILRSEGEGRGTSRSEPEGQARPPGVPTGSGRVGRRAQGRGASSREARAAVVGAPAAAPAEMWEPWVGGRRYHDN